MYQLFVIVIFACAFGGMGYFLYNDDVSSSALRSVQGSFSDTNNETNFGNYFDALFQPKKPKVPLPTDNVFLAQGLEGLYIASNGAKLYLSKKGPAYFVGYNGVRRDGSWTIDTSNTIMVVLPDTYNPETKVFSLGQTNNDLVETSSIIKGVYKKQ